MSKPIDEFFSFDYNAKETKPIENAVSESVKALSQAATTRKGKTLMSEEEFNEKFKDILEELDKL